VTSTLVQGSAATKKLKNTDIVALYKCVFNFDCLADTSTDFTSERAEGQKLVVLALSSDLTHWLLVTCNECVLCNDLFFVCVIYSLKHRNYVCLSIFIVQRTVDSDYTYEYFSS